MALDPVCTGWNLIVDTLRELAPEDFPKGYPIYGMTNWQVAGSNWVRLREESWLHGYTACTSLGLAEKLRPDLERYGAWQGPGFAILFDGESLRDYTNPMDPLSVTLHEAAHHIEDKTFKHCGGEVEGDYYVKHMREKLVNHGLHTALWSRCAAHLCHRAEQAGLRVRPEQVCGGPTLGSNHPLARFTLTDELNWAPPRASIEMIVLGNDPGPLFHSYWGLPQTSSPILRTFQQACHYPGKVWN